MLQLAKSAICAGLLTLIQNENLAPLDISVLYIAGGFGSYLNPQSAARIGLLPKDIASRSIAVGNAALVGASMLLLNDQWKHQIMMIVNNTKVLDLASNSIFIDQYTEGMLLE